MNGLRRLTPLAALAFAGVLGAGLALAGAGLLGDLSGSDTVTVRDVTVEGSTQIPTTFRTARR